MSARLSLVTFCLVASVLTASPVPAQRDDPASITANEMQAHVDFLASDCLQGREAGQAGAAIAARYIASQFRAAGLSPLLKGWEMEFDAPGLAGPATAVLSLPERRFTGASVVQVPACSATAVVTAPISLGDTDSLAGKVVVVDLDGAETDVRDRAAELATAGAAAVVFVTGDEWLEDRPHGDLRRMGGGHADLPGDGGAGVITIPDLDLQLSPEDLADPTKLAEKIKQRLQEQGMDVSNLRVVTSPGLLDSAVEMSVGELPPGAVPADRTPGNPFDLGARGSRLAIPVLRVCRPLGEALLHAARDHLELALEVTRPGRDASSNVLALVPGTDPELAGEYVLIGAHYDHVGTGSDGTVWNGADDNASGTAAILEIGEALASGSIRPRRSIILAAWGAEEKGVLGSNAFIRAAPVPLERIVAAINLDMISRNDPAALDLACASDDLTTWAKQAAQEHGFTLEDAGGFTLHMSDSAPFVAREIPTAFLNTGDHADLHAPTDDAEKIDAEKAARVSRVALDIALRAANASERPGFTKQAAEFSFPGVSFAVAERSGRRLGIFSVSDAGPDGIEVGGVVPGSIAEKIGIVRGDRIVRIAEHRIEKASAIAAALKDIPVGEPFEIEIARAAAGGEVERLVLQGSFDD
ncbi:MAG: M20/M25/M40 family metallo-hydrolase [Planctomycetota bacterium]